MGNGTSKIPVTAHIPPTTLPTMIIIKYFNPKII